MAISLSGGFPFLRRHIVSLCGRCGFLSRHRFRLSALFLFFALFCFLRVFLFFTSFLFSALFFCSFYVSLEVLGLFPPFLHWALLRPGQRSGAFFGAPKTSRRRVCENTLKNGCLLVVPAIFDAILPPCRFPQKRLFLSELQYLFRGSTEILAKKDCAAQGC